MKPVISKELRRELGHQRHKTVLLGGLSVPQSAITLLSMLESETDPFNRFQIYLDILVECSVADKTAAQVKFALDYYKEFEDSLSLMSYGRALIRDGKFDEGLARAKEALDLAIKDEKFINDCAVSYVREAINTGSVDAVNAALDSLVMSTQMPRTTDCRLEVDWIDAAVALGADTEILEWVKSVAAGGEREP